MKKSFESLSRKIVCQCLRVKPGNRFLICCGDPFYFNFCEQIALRAVEIGAHPAIIISSDKIFQASFKKDKDYLQKPSDFHNSIIDVADIELALIFPRDPSIYENLDPEKLAAASRRGEQTLTKTIERNREKLTFRKASMLLPTPEAAKKYHMPYKQYEDLIWNSLDIDYESLSTISRKILKAMENAADVRITSPSGTDLKLSFKGRKIFVDDGIYSDEDFEERVFMSNLPAGEICVAPVEDSVEGIAFFKYNIFYGTEIKNLYLVFEKGKIKSIEAEEGAEFYRQVLESQTGAKDSIAELGIGTNPNVNTITGNLALDEKIKGTIHIATGDNRVLGGKQESSFHWDLVMTMPTLKVENKIVMKDGEFFI